MISVFRSNHLMRLFLPAALTFCGCASVTVKSSDGWEASYSRVGNTNISGVTIVKEGGKVAVRVDQAVSEKEIVDALKSAGEVAAKVAIP